VHFDDFVDEFVVIFLTNFVEISNFLNVVATNSDFCDAVEGQQDKQSFISCELKGSLSVVDKNFSAVLQAMKFTSK
jgi:hypothetical protein